REANVDRKRQQAAQRECDQGNLNEHVQGLGTAVTARFGPMIVSTVLNEFVRLSPPGAVNGLKGRRSGVLLLTGSSGRPDLGMLDSLASTAMASVSNATSVGLTAITAS